MVGQHCETRCNFEERNNNAFLASNISRTKNNCSFKFSNLNKNSYQLHNPNGWIRLGLENSLSKFFDESRDWVDDPVSTGR